MTIPWTELVGFVGVLIGTRLRIPVGDRKPLIMLLSFAIAVGLLISLSLAPALELPGFLLIGIAVGFGCRLMDEKDGYLVRGNDPEVEMDR